MSTKSEQLNQIARAAKKAGVTPNQIVGNKSARKPAKDRPGLYLRLSPKTGEVCWAYWSGKSWGLYSNSKKGAMARRHKTSKKQLTWFGYYKKA